MNMKQLQCVAQTLWIGRQDQDIGCEVKRKNKNFMGHHEKAIQRLSQICSWR